MIDGFACFRGCDRIGAPGGLRLMNLDGEFPWRPALHKDGKLGSLRCYGCLVKPGQPPFPKLPFNQNFVSSDHLQSNHRGQDHREQRGFYGVQQCCAVDAAPAGAGVPALDGGVAGSAGFGVAPIVVDVAEDAVLA